MGRENVMEVRATLHSKLVKRGLDWLEHRVDSEVLGSLSFFLQGGQLPRRECLVYISGAFGMDSEETNRILRLVGYEELKEGEAADGTMIADLGEKVASLEETVAELNKVIAAIREGLQYPIPSVDEMKGMFSHRLDSTP